MLGLSASATRGDVMRMLHATNIFAPNTIAVPLNEKGNPTFRLDTLAPANGFAHENAHDAMADVEATIYMAKLIRDRSPTIWQNMIRHSSKQNAIQFMEENVVFASADTFFGRSFSWILTHCGSNPEYSAEIAAFDLSFSPEDYLDLSVDELVGVLSGKTKPIRIIRANSQPILMPVDLISEMINSADQPADEIQRRADQIQKNKDFQSRMGQALNERFGDEDKSPYVEKNIYDAFPPKSDEVIMSKFHIAGWPERLDLAKQLSDSRLRDLARRQIYFERPDLLSDDVREDLEKWLSNRLSTEDPETPWRTIPKALEEADDLLGSIDKEELVFMTSVREFISGLAKTK
jgi:exodeoxyribonuclease I